MPPVAVLLTVTVAPGMAPPDESVTSPLIPPCVCAHAVATDAVSRITTVSRRATEPDLCLMFFSKVTCEHGNQPKHAA
jgi:hypothetical protein